MDFLTLIVALLSFGLSFVFALGGVGSALVLIPVLTWLGIPFIQARPIGLFVNGVSMLGATFSNIRQKRLDYRLGLPIILASALLAPVGALVGHQVSARAVLLVFIAFLFFSGMMILFFKGASHSDRYREDLSLFGRLLVGVAAGFFSGLLGVGGGGVISPLLIIQGVHPKKVTTITAFAVPFSSFSAFLTYLAMGSVSWTILAVAGLSAWCGGYLGTMVMHQRMRPGTVRRILGVVLLLLGLRLLFQLS
ncbi:sulfite exporter TauE/SafE family protein [Desulfogranum mediterraneum]|uniref:sulfite exporter TauE/SafE family protein n=1 Tax=Desulfogranum mediterraneum TaxID=160661 RepID=UPI0004032DEB|nr:sulfite exporter TauE/SafE family protein [Desulfogranum mediterraneum]